MIAVAAALVAAVGFAFAAVLQQREAAAAPSRTVGHLSLLWHLVHRPVWLLGGLTAFVAVGLHIFALSRATLVQIQPLGAATPVFAVLLRSALERTRPGTRDLIGAGAVGLGLAGLFLGVRTHGTISSFGLGIVGLIVVVGGAIAAVMFALTWSRTGTPRAFGQALGAGTALGMVSALVRVCLLALHRQPAPVLLLILAVVAAAGFVVAGQLLLQTAYQTGRLALVLATQTIVDPLTASGVGVGLLGEPFTVVVPALAVLGPIAIVLGVVLLARTASGHRKAPSRRGARPPRARDRSRPLRVLVGTDTYPPHVNGAAVFAQRLAHGLAAAGCEVHVVTSGSSRQGGVEHEGGERARVSVHRLPSLPVPTHPELGFCPPWRVERETRRVLEAVDPDVVHVQTHYLIGRALSRLAPDAGIPVAATNHFMPDNLLVHLPLPRAVLEPVARWAWRDCSDVLGRAAAVTTPTPTAADLLQAKGVTGVHPISCGVDLSRFAAPAHPDHERPLELPGRPAILFVGRLDPDKRIVDLIDALPQVRADVDAHLIIAGTGSQRGELERRAARRGVAEVTHFLGFVPDADLPDLYASADVFAMPGIAELQSLVTLEAMATGRPVVAANAVALPHLVHDGRNGYLFPPGDVDALAGALRAVLTDPERAARMGQESLAIAASHDVAASTQQFLGLYRQMLGEDPEGEVTSTAAGSCCS